jgi:peptidoglycan/LPS O-acetylase OafA/YrhL
LTFFSLITGIVALGTEVLVFMSLMEMPPFGKGGSDIIWGLPFFALVVFALAISGLLAALAVRRNPTRAGKLATAGFLLNGLSLVIPILVLVLAVGRLLISDGGVTNR